MGREAAPPQGLGTPPQGLQTLRESVANYYGSRLAAYGATPLGVDWSCQLTQDLRFAQLLRACDFSGPFSLDDLGCGYGALLAFLARRHPGAGIDYLGIDMSPAMVARARSKWRRQERVAFAVGDHSPRTADYTVASGIFNVRLEADTPLWEQWIDHTLARIAASSRLGFAVNFLAPLPDGALGKPQLYRTAPGHWRGLCGKLGFASSVLDNYGMREFTLLARRDPAVP